MRTLLYSILALLIMVGCSDVSSPDVNESESQFEPIQSVSPGIYIYNNVKAYGHLPATCNNGNDSDVSTSGSLEPAPDPTAPCVRSYQLSAERQDGTKAEGNFRMIEGTKLNTTKLEGEVNCIEINDKGIDGNLVPTTAKVGGKLQNGDQFLTVVNNQNKSVTYPEIVGGDLTCGELLDVSPDFAPFSLQGNISID